jgi:hypothetical protein
MNQTMYVAFWVSDGILGECLSLSEVEWFQQHSGYMHPCSSQSVLMTMAQKLVKRSPLALRHQKSVLSSCRSNRGKSFYG